MTALNYERSTLFKFGNLDIGTTVSGCRSERAERRSLARSATQIRCKRVPLPPRSDARLDPVGSSGRGSD